MVTLFASAYMAEVIRGGIAGIPKGQVEAANAAAVLLEDHVSDRDATGAEDFDPWDRQHLHRTFQGHNAWS